MLSRGRGRSGSGGWEFEAKRFGWDGGEAFFDGVDGAEDEFVYGVNYVV